MVIIKKKSVSLAKFPMFAILLVILAFAGLSFMGATNAQANDANEMSLDAISLTSMTAKTSFFNVTIVSWNMTGLDENKPFAGTNFTTIQVNICDNGSDGVNSTNVWANFSWLDTYNEDYIYLRPHETEHKYIENIPNGTCIDVEWVVYINRSTPTGPKLKYEDYYRNFTINVTSSDVTEPATVNDTLWLNGLVGPVGENDLILSYCPNTAPLSTIFCISYNYSVMNTEAPTMFPVDYDPAVVELINFSISNFSYTYYNFDLFSPNGLPFKEGQITYCFYRKSTGDAAISPMIIEYRGHNYKYAGPFPLPTPPVPELATVVLFGLGLFALAGYVSYRKRT